MVWPIQQKQTNNVMMPPQAFGRGYSPQQPGTDLHQFTRGLLTPERINGWSQHLNNVQKVLNVVQQTAPMIQQYGPMIKNLPMLFQLMKAMNEDDADTSSENRPEKPSEKGDKLEEPQSESDSEHLEKSKAKTLKTGESSPKLYI